MPFWKRQRQKSAAERQNVGNIMATEAEPTESDPDGVTIEHVGGSVRAVQYGMHIFQNQPSNAPRVVDIVAIHGLNGHYEKTWTTTSQGNVNWLQDLLPQQLPNARIMSYSYNSIVEFSKAVSGIKIFAEQLLEDLISWRLTVYERERPIIFICHSLGGLVFKQVYITPTLFAYNRPLTDKCRR
jgi:hypothetical protein